MIFFGIIPEVKQVLVVFSAASRSNADDHAFPEGPERLKAGRRREVG